MSGTVSSGSVRPVSDRSALLRRAFVMVMTVTLLGTVLIGVGASPASAVVPGVPTAVSASAATQTSVVLSWTDSGAPTTYAITSDPAAAGLTHDGANGGTVSGLTPGVTYTFTVVATNDDGSSAASDPSNAITTLQQPSAPQSVAEVAKDHQSITVSWDAPVTVGNPAAGYTALANGSIEGVVTGTSAIFSGLDASTSHTIVVSATNSEGSASAAALDVVTDPEPVAPAGPATVTIGAITETSIAVSWTAVPEEDNGGAPIKEYAVFANGTEVIFSSASTSGTLTGLVPGTTYEISVLARNDNDLSSDATDGGSATTYQAPGAFEANAEVSSGTTATVTWTDPGGEVPPSYGIDVVPNEGVVLGDRNGLSTPISGLTPGTAYVVTVTATNQSGETTAATDSFTPNQAPGATTNVTAAIQEDVNGIEPIWVELSWTAAETNGTPVTQYTIVHEDGPTELANIEVALEDLTLEDGRYIYKLVPTLDPGDYQFSVYASNSAGDGASGSTGEFAVPASPGVTDIKAVNVTPIGDGTYAPLPYGSYVTVTWEPPTETGGLTVTSYTVSMAGLEATNINPAARTATVGPLEAGTYIASIRAFTGAGEGAISFSNQVEVRAFPPFNSAAAFVRQQYVDFLGRTAETAGLNYWLTQTAANGSNTQAIIERFMASPEFSPRRSVVRLYAAYFPNRDMDLGGFDFWSKRIASGASDVESVSQFFATSDEFQGTYGSLGDADFVELVYENVLGRSPDAPGFAYWQGRLANGLSRGTLMTNFSESPENIAATSAHVDVVVTYRGMLNRLPEDEGHDFWVSKIESDSNALLTLIRGFFVTEEYANRITP